MTNSWTTPKLKSYPLESDKDWYVWFRFNGGNPIRVKEDLNKFLDLDERLQEGIALAKAVEIRLKQGWIPECSLKFNRKLDTRTILEVADISYNLKVLQLDKNSQDNYRVTITFFKEALSKLNISRLVSLNFDRMYAKLVLEHLKTEKKWKNKNYNKHLCILRSIFYEGLESGYFKTNPFGEIKNLKVIKTIANTPPTDEEMVEICDQLKSKNLGFYIFYMLVYNCGIRPEEIRNLKIRNLDFKNQNIILDAENTKTDKKRIIPMLGNVYELLSNYEGMNPNLFVFGTWVPNGGRHSQRNWFLPNVYQLKDDTPNRQWKKLIKDELGIDKNMYSAKHKGADDKLEAGMDIETICAIFGHSKTLMTERYIHSLNSARLDKARLIKMKTY